MVSVVACIPQNFGCFAKCPLGSHTVADEEYYEEMAENHARVQRVKLSEKYKGYAMMYLCEAISLYLEWKKENPEKCKSNPDHRFHLSVEY